MDDIVELLLESNSKLIIVRQLKGEHIFISEDVATIAKYFKDRASSNLSYERTPIHHDVVLIRDLLHYYQLWKVSNITAEQFNKLQTLLSQ